MQEEFKVRSDADNPHGFYVSLSDMPITFQFDLGNTRHQFQMSAETARHTAALLIQAAEAAEARYLGWRK